MNAFKLVLRRVLIAPILLFVIATFTFFLGILAQRFHDPVASLTTETTTAKQLADLHHQYGLDRPVLSRYGDWLSGAVRGDLGRPLKSNIPVSRIVGQALPVTVSLAFGGLLVGLLIGLPAGLIAALRPQRLLDRTMSAGAAVGQSVPGFWLGILFVTWFALERKWFPATGFRGPTEGIVPWIKSITLPSIALGLAASATICRQTRSAMLGALQQEYVRTAIAKGLPLRTVVLKHALKNAAAPTVTSIAFILTALLSGSVVVERVFAMQGLGSVAIDAVVGGEQLVLLGVVVATALIVVAVGVILDLTYMWLNPKVRIQ